MPPLRHPAGKAVLALVLLAILQATTGCSRKPSDITLDKKIEPRAEREEWAPDETPENVLATIDGDIITVEAYKREMASLSPQYKPLSPDDKAQFLDAVINKTILLKEAKKENLHREKEVADLIRKMEEEIIIQEFIDRQISNKTDISGEEIKAYYLDNPEEFKEPAKTRARHILVESRLMAAKILSDLERGISFEELARRYTLDVPSRQNGGDLGYFECGTLISDFEKACLDLDVGEISKPVKTELGYHIIEVLDRQKEGVRGLDEVSEEIRAKLLMEKEVSAYNDFLRKLRRGKEIIVHEDVLSDLDLDL